MRGVICCDHPIVGAAAPFCPGRAHTTTDVVCPAVGCAVAGPTEPAHYGLNRVVVQRGRLHGTNAIKVFIERGLAMNGLVLVHP